MDTNPVLKMAIGLIILGLEFAVMIVAAGLVLAIVSKPLKRLIGSAR